MEPQAHRVVLIRHAEKPDGNAAGVDYRGVANPKALTVRGWQRAGALASVLAGPAGSGGDERLVLPAFLYASHSSSDRPRQTLEPLAAKLGIPIALDFGKGDEERLAGAALPQHGPVLICWQHEGMSAVANAILRDATTAPQRWPENRFDVFWIFDLDADSGRYRFRQRPQTLLFGDSPTVIT